MQEDSRAARVFERFGLDFCCNGRRTLREAADSQGVALDDIVSTLADLGDPGAEDAEPAEWQDLGVLVHHIIERHHAYVRLAAPAIQRVAR